VVARDLTGDGLPEAVAVVATGAVAVVNTSR
jgi:hypothetical protein